MRSLVSTTTARGGKRRRFYTLSWLLCLIWPLFLARATTASNVSVVEHSSKQQRQQHQQQQQNDESSSNHHQHGTFNSIVVTTFTPISKRTTTLNAKQAISSSSLLNRQTTMTPSFSKQAVHISQSSSSSSSSSPYAFTSLSELLHDISSSSGSSRRTNTRNSDTGFAQRLKQQEQQELKAVIDDETTLSTTTNDDDAIAMRKRKRNYLNSPSPHIWQWQPIFGSVVLIMFTSAVLANPSVIWLEIWQTATQVLAVHGLYKLFAVVVGHEQQHRSWMKRAALMVLQLGYTSFFQIPSFLYFSQSQSQVQMYAQPQSWWQNRWGAITTSSAYAAAATATVFVAQTLQRMVVNEVWNRFWKGTWMNQVVLSTIYYKNPFFVFPTPTATTRQSRSSKTQQNEEQEEETTTTMRGGDHSWWLDKYNVAQDFMSATIQRGSGKLIQRIVEKHVMRVASGWVQHSGVFLRQV
jgi:hypothetical protein